MLFEVDHPDADTLESRWAARAREPRDLGRVHTLVQRLGDSRHATPDQVELSPEEGMAGDRWADKGSPGRQITLMDLRVVEVISARGQPAHLPGDNLVVDLPTDLDTLPAGQHVRIGDVVLVVTTKSHLGCKKFQKRFGDGALTWVNDLAHRSRQLRGVNCDIVVGGTVRVGDLAELVDAP